MSRKRKILLFSTLIVIILGIVLVIFTIIRPKRTDEKAIGSSVTVPVLLVPSDASMILDGKEYKNTPKEVSTTIGTHTVIVTREGFNTETSQVVINNDSDKIIVALSPQSDEANEWVDKNQSEYMLAESEGGIQATKNAELFTSNNPITDYLPVIQFTYAIGYKLDSSDKTGQSIIITIDAREGYKNAAIDAIRKLGFDPGDYKIEFDNYKNPFK